MPNYSHRKNKAGFTLIELLLYVALSAMIALVVSSLLIMILQSRVKNQTVTLVEHTGMQAMQHMTQTIRNAVRVNSPAPAGISPTLSLTVSTSTLNPTLFESAAGALRSTEGSASPVLLTPPELNVSNLLFYNLSRNNTSGTIRIEFTLNRLNAAGRSEFEYQKTFYGSATIR